VLWDPVDEGVAEGLDVDFVVLPGVCAGVDACGEADDEVGCAAAEVEPSTAPTP